MLVVSERRASACLIMLSAKQGNHLYHFNAFGMARPGIEPTTSAPEADALPFALSDRSKLVLDLYGAASGWFGEVCGFWWFGVFHGPLWHYTTYISAPQIVRVY